MSRITIAIVSFVLGLASFFLYQKLNSTSVDGTPKISVAYPSFYFSLDKTSYACKPIVGGFLFGDQNKKVANAELIRESDTIAIEIQDKKAIVLSESATKAGYAQGDEFTIYQNDKEMVKMIRNHNGLSFHYISINKKSGIAHQTKSVDGLGEFDDGLVSAYLLYCQ
jgi:hypothetical protein